MHSPIMFAPVLNPKNDYQGLSIKRSKDGLPGNAGVLLSPIGLHAPRGLNTEILVH